MKKPFNNFDPIILAVMLALLIVVSIAAIIEHENLETNKFLSIPNAQLTQQLEREYPTTPEGEAWAAKVKAANTQP
jgi:hypothetical protein